MSILYVISRSSFVNPLTRATLTYDDCVRLDTYLQEHVYSSGGGDNDHVSALVGFDGQTIISVREAFALRDSIKVKVDRRGVVDIDQQQQRVQHLRNEAAIALRGLFIFGHDRSRRRATDAEHILRNDQQQRRLPSGFDLRSRPDSNLIEGGLYRVIDDDDAALNSADYAEWNEVQEEFPCLSGENPRQASYISADNDQASQILETVRRTANLTLIEERERSDRIQRTRRQYFLEALERKRLRIVARESSRRDAADLVSKKRDEESIIESARREIEEWRTAQWDEWERVAATSKIHESNEYVTRLADVSTTTLTIDDELIEPDHSGFDSTDDKGSKAVAKRKAKRQKAKEREKEKKRLEKLEMERNERAVATQKAKEESKSRCGACGEGILGCGFEKYGVNFCSTRSGPSTSQQ